MPPRTEEAVYELPSVVADMDAMRGSVLVLDWRWLRDNAMFDRYAEALWGRSFRGGSIAAFKTGERSGRLEIRQTPLAGSKFFRASFAGVTVAGLEPFCRRALAQEIREARTPTSFDLRISWSDGEGPTSEG